MTEQISSPLRRPIRSGSQYNSLFPKVSCDVASNFGDNKNTIQGVEFMAQMVKKYSYQVKKLAKKLQKSSLNENVLAIDDFLFHHFQYQADAALQQLRSPACSWYHRQNGIDCKSYAILAMSLLNQMNYKGYFRQIKQPGFYPDQFTHVYVIVPTNQNSAADVTDFNGDYLVIDPTDKTKREPIFIDKKDKYMSGLSYVGLNASSSTSEEKEPIQHIIDNASVFKQAGFSKQNYVELVTYIQTLMNSGLLSNQIRIQFSPQGLQVSTQNANRLFTPNNVFNWRERFFAAIRENGLNASDSGGDIDFDELLSTFTDILGGIGGGWYDANEVEADSQTIVDYFGNLITQINQGVANQNFNTVAEKTAEFTSMSTLLVRVADCAEKRCFEGSTWGTKTRNGMKAIRRLCERIKQNGNTLVNNWVEINFIKGGQIRSYQLDSNQFYKPGGSIFKLLKADGKNKGIDYTEKVSVRSLSPKPNSEIKALTFNVELVENDVVNVTSILQNLSNVLFSSGSQSGGGSGNNAGGSGNNAGGSGNASWSPTVPPTTNQASIGGFSTKTLAIGIGVTALGFLLWPTIKKTI